MDRQRVDKWLWHARVVRTRSAAAALADGGRVRINGARIDTSSRPVRPGDVITVALDHGVRILKVSGYAERRGSADDARVLYEDLSPRPEERSEAGQQPTAGSRESGAGRPTKRERRAIDRLRARDDPGPGGTGSGGHDRS